MRTNKKLVFAVGGLAGGIAGALLGELVPELGGSMVALVINTAIWSLLSSALITVGLFAAGEYYNRRPISVEVLRKGFLSGAVAGGIAGFIAQSVYSFQGEPTFFNQVIFRSFCWGIMGALLGLRLSSVVPNLGLNRGVIAGAVGGFIGGIGFVITSEVFAELFGRLLGIGLLGAALGLAVVAIEEIFRAARLDVVWAPKEVTSVTLGQKPVFIGGGDDHIYVAGLPQHALGVVLEGGKIYCLDNSSGKRSDLKDGSRIQIGKIEVVVRTTASGRGEM